MPGDLLEDAKETKNREEGSMLRAAIVEKSKEHREYIRAGLQGLNMEIQVSEFSNEYDYLENVGEEASAFDILLLNTQSAMKEMGFVWQQRSAAGTGKS